MCFCCCESRKAILIYLIVITCLAFIYGIISISKFGSNTDIYKMLNARIKELEKQSTSSNNNNYNYNYNNYNSNYRRIDYNPYTNSYSNNYNYAKAVLDAESAAKIASLTSADINNNSHGMIKNLKGIEKGLGVVLFVFIIIFLVIEIFYMIFASGNKESQIMKNNIYNILNISKIISLTLSIIFIFLSILYGILLIVALAEYINLVGNMDSCTTGIIINIIFAYYCFWFFITLSCGFSKERTLFVDVGCEEKPGPKALYDVNGNPLPRQIMVVSAASLNQPNQTTGVNYQQVPIINQQGYGIYQQQQQIPIQQIPIQQTQSNQVQPNQVQPNQVQPTQEQPTQQPANDEKNPK